MAKTVVLSVGDSFQLMRGKDHITYAGMVCDETYSIVQRKSQLVPGGWRGYAWNLFYPSTKKDINIDGIDIHIENRNLWTFPSVVTGICTYYHI